MNVKFDVVPKAGKFSSVLTLGLSFASYIKRSFWAPFMSLTFLPHVTTREEYNIALVKLRASPVAWLVKNLPAM